MCGVCGGGGTSSLSEKVVREWEFYSTKPYGGQGCNFSYYCVGFSTILGPKIDTRNFPDPLGEFIYGGRGLRWLWGIQEAEISGKLCVLSSLLWSLVYFPVSFHDSLLCLQGTKPFKIVT